MKSMRLARLLVPACVAAGFVVVGPPAPAGAADPAPPTSTAVRYAADPSARPPVTVLTGIRVGRHVGFDRVVFDLSGPAVGFDVRYVSTLVQDASGKTLPVNAGAILRVAMRTVQAHNDAGVSTCACDKPSLAFPAVRQIRSAGDFEGVVSYGIGVRDRTGFRVSRLSGPTRLVVDIAWSAGLTSGRLLFQGTSGTDVKGWQRDLNALTVKDLAVDGSFGLLTKAATVAFQKTHGLLPDGVVGARTRAAMLASLRG